MFQMLVEKGFELVIAIPVVFMMQFLFVDESEVLCAARPDGVTDRLHDAIANAPANFS